MRSQYVASKDSHTSKKDASGGYSMGYGDSRGAHFPKTVSRSVLGGLVRADQIQSKQNYKGRKTHELANQQEWDPNNYPKQSLKQLEIETVYYISRFLNQHNYFWVPGKMFVSMENSKTFSNLGLLQEIEDTCSLIDSFICELLNLFDNYICFEGDKDQVFFDKACKNAYLRVENARRCKKFNLNDLTKTVFDLGCEKALQLIRDHNQSICSNEFKIAAFLKSEAYGEFHAVINDISVKWSSRSDLDILTDRIQKLLVIVVTRCMDSGGRINNIQTTTIRELITYIREQVYKKAETTIKAQNPIKYAVYLYQKQMEEIYKNLSEFDERAIAEKHTKALAFAKKGLREADATIVQNIVRTQNINALQIRDEKIQLGNLTRAKEDLKTLCIYITPQWIQVYINQNGKCTSLLYENNTKISPLVGLTRNNKPVIGYAAQKEQEKNLKHPINIEKCIKKVAEGNEICKYILISLFKKLRIGAKQAFEIDFHRTLVVLPASYNTQLFRVIRESTVQAGFQEVYIIRESLVAAQMIIQTFEKVSEYFESQVVASFSILESGVYVEIFGKNLKRSGILEMLGVSYTSFTKSDMSPSDRSSMLDLALNKAINQVESSRRSSSIVCYLFAQLEEWQSDFNLYCKSQKHIVPRKCARDEFAFLGSGKLLADIRNFRAKFRDCVMVDIWDDDNAQEDIDTSSETHEVANDITNQNESNDELRQKKEDLLGLCTHMRQQIDSGEVKIRKLFLKDIIETLEIAEELALEKNSNLAEIKQQEKDITDIYREYKFS